MAKDSDVQVPSTKYYAALKSLVQDGTVWAQCFKCGMILSNQEFQHSNCNVCGKLDFKTEIFFRRKTQVC